VRATAESTALSRKELHELVWSIPMQKLAAQYSLSDRGLAKICEKHWIPAPGRGYWAKKAAGHRAPKQALPPLPPALSHLDSIVLHAWGVADEPPLPPAVLRQTQMEHAPENLIVVADTLRGSHVLVRQTAEALKSSKGPATEVLHNYATRHLDVQVSRECLPRALRILDALVKAFEKRGWRVSVGTGDERNTYVTVREQRVAFGIREKLKKVKSEPPKPVRGFSGQMYTPYRSEYDTVPSGKLSLVLRETWGSSVRRSWDETESTKLEERLNEFVIGVVMQAEEQLEFARRVEENARQARAAEVLRYERERQRQLEAARVSALTRQADAWDQSHRIASYLAAVRSAAERSGVAMETGSPLGDWVAWAEDYARNLDPLSRPLETLPTL
jgi:hypothetical protein